MTGVNSALAAENTALRDEVGMYRKVLRDIVRQCSNSGYGSPPVMERMIDRIEEMAIDALGSHRNLNEQVNSDE